MGAPINLVGRRFGRLTVECKATERNRGPIVWQCRCECGQSKLVSGAHLSSGHTQSCGCLRSPPSQLKHGHSYRDGRATPEYAAWAGMKNRCGNPNAPNYADYGGRGIAVCERWRDDFEAFLADMGPRPSPKHSIDRFPNNDGNYEPGNCRWATNIEQGRNRRSNHLVRWQRQEMTVTEAAARAGKNISLVRSRIQRGWSIERALS